MKKYIIAMVALLGTFFTQANAMSYEQAREQALFLTDKMAYELNLDEEQYEAAYEVNLDYLLSVNTYDDVFSDYWIHRNTDLRYILLDWQYEAFCAASYFYRPLWWEDGYWHFGIYARYPHRDYFYFGRPHFYVSYRGGHGWHHNGGRSWYHTNFTHAHRGTHRSSFTGMRDGWNRGDYRGGRIERGSRGTHRAEPHRGTHRPDAHNGTHRPDANRDAHRGGPDTHRNSSTEPRKDGNNGGPRIGSNRESSTRTTVGRQGFNSSSSSDRVAPERRPSDRSSFNRSSERSSSSRSGSSTRSFTPSRSTSTGSYSGSHSSSSRSSSFGGSRSSSSHSSGSHGGGSHGGGSHGGGSHGGGHGGRR